MSARLAPQPLVLAALLTASGATAFWLLAGLLAPERAGFAPAPLGLTAAAPPPVVETGELAARPPFKETRRSAAPEPTAQSVPSTFPKTLRLTATLLTGDAQRAILADTAGGEPISLGIGDAVAGFTVKEIGRDRIIVDRAGVSSVVYLLPAGERS